MCWSICVCVGFFYGETDIKKYRYDKVHEKNDLCKKICKNSIFFEILPTRILPNAVSRRFVGQGRVNDI